MGSNKIWFPCSWVKQNRMYIFVYICWLWMSCLPSCHNLSSNMQGKNGCFPVRGEMKSRVAAGCCLQSRMESPVSENTLEILEGCWILQAVPWQHHGWCKCLILFVQWKACSFHQNCHISLC
jgi:hypothetical protein